MLKKVFLTSILIVLMALTYSIKISSYNFIITDQYTAINSDDNINIYKEHILKYSIDNAKLLDLDNDYLVYNKENSLYLYDMITHQSTYIHNNSYNAKLFNNQVVFESDYDHEYICKNLVDTVKYRNCYKLYLYDIDLKIMKRLELIGLDNYLSDFSNGIIAYTSIHNIDEFCLGICSYVNTYDLKSKENLIINKYNDLLLDMSGNAYLDNDILYFESSPNIYGCNHSQIFSFDLNQQMLNLVTAAENKCFYENSEIIYVGEGYVIFKSNYNNYEDNKEHIFVYSYVDKKYDIINNSCNFTYDIFIDDKNIYCLVDEIIKIEKIDNNSPQINKNIIYTALKEQREHLISILDYSDNLSSKQNIKVNIISNLDQIGEQYVEVELCDSFDNCIIDKILVDIIDKDITPPKIYCQDSINIKRKNNLNINNYGYAIDNVDGRLALEIIGNIDFTKSGSQQVLIRSIDSSNNISYKEITLIIYDDFNLYLLYVIPAVLTLFMIVIIYILRFKKDHHI